MLLADLIHPDTVLIDSSSRSKTAVFLKISQLIHHACPSLDIEGLFDAYWKRESLGCTAIGYGIMIPHIRCESIEHTFGCFLKLVHPVDFGAEDKQPIDLVFGLAVPQQHTDQHLKILADIISRFNQASFRQQCRQAKTNALLYHLLISQHTPSLATIESF